MSYSLHIDERLARLARCLFICCVCILTVLSDSLSSFPSSGAIICGVVAILADEGGARQREGYASHVAAKAMAKRMGAVGESSTSVGTGAATATWLRT